MNGVNSILVSDDRYFQEILPGLSQTARLLWGKTSKDKNDEWLPLYVHLSDSVAIAEILWERWVPLSTKKVLARAVLDAIGANDEPEALLQAKKLFLACAAVHDVGKATPAFQIKARYSNPDVFNFIGNQEPRLRFVTMANPEKIPHALASQAIVERHGWSRNIAIVLGGHHGKPPSVTMLMNDLEAFPANTGFTEAAWQMIQNELVNYALSLIELKPDDALFRIEINKTAQIMFTGLLIMADWLASDESRFNYLPITVMPGILDSPTNRAFASWDGLQWPDPWHGSGNSTQAEFFNTRFGFSPRPSQQMVVKVLQEAKDPGLIIIEAPMGEGKTEAALAAAEIMAAKTGSGGIFVALPTQATSDGMFPRVKQWIDTLGDESLHSIYLAHSKRLFNKDYQDLSKDRDSIINQVGIDSDINEKRAAAVVNNWFEGRKRGILADFVVGTIDQILMAGLKQKHLALRHLALANKVVIIDECHAYDAYMSSYLYKVLAWLGAYRVPTIVLSATLPKSKRKLIVDSYLSKDSAPKTSALPWLGIPATESELPEWAITTAYPLITYTDGEDTLFVKPEKSTRSLHVKLQRFDEKMLISELQKLLINGGCAGVIVNTVSRAQHFAQLCAEVFGTKHVVLHHSQFIAPDRIAKEGELRKQLGPPADNPDRPPVLIVVGTQVLEQSLDIDFDVLFTDVCPMDLLIQRIGRMHRHSGRKRPPALQQANCYVMGILEDGGYEKGSEHIYSKYLLMNTDILLPDEMLLPDDISCLVQKAYSEKGLEDLSKRPSEYRETKEKFDSIINIQQAKANTFQVSLPGIGTPTMVGWLDVAVISDSSEKRGEATVRDSGDSIEVLLIQQFNDKNMRIFPWITELGGTIVPTDSVPPVQVAKAIAKCTVKLPARFCYPWNIDQTIKELEQNNIDKGLLTWQDSKWLEGELFLVLDSEYETELAGQTLRYSKENGLFVERRDDD